MTWGATAPMRPKAWRRPLIVACVLALGCTPDDTAERAQLLDAAAARRLIGSWDVAFLRDPTRPMSADAAQARVVAGTIAFAEDHHGRIASAELRDPTHDGVYDIGFEPFGFSTRDARAVPIAVARVVPTPGRDSLYIVLSPGTARFAVRMSGTLSLDSAAGVWRAAAYSAGGGSGSFVMRRRAEAGTR